MKITDPDIIKSGEEDLIEAVKSDLNLDAVKEILKDRLKAAPLSSRGGEIVVHDNQIAFRLDFDIMLSGSLLFDRDGNYIAEDDSSPVVSDDLDPEDPPMEERAAETNMDAEDLAMADDSDLDDLEMDNLDMDDMPDFNEDGDDLSEDDDLDMDEEIIELEDIEDDPDIAPEEALKDDINDIIRESREFWEQKKG